MYRYARLRPVGRFTGFGSIGLVAILGLLIFTSGAASAETSKEQKLVALIEHAENAKGRLNLSEEQEKQINPIVEASRDKKIAILERYGFGKGKKPTLSLRTKIKLGKEMKAVRKDTEKALSRYLTPDQLKEYKKIQDESRSLMKKAMNGK